MVGEEEGKSQGIDRVEDDEVMHDLNDRATWHISCDRTCTWIEVTQLSVVCGQEEQTLMAHSL